MSNSVIEFHTSPELINRIPHPFPANRGVPDWLKNMPADASTGLPAEPVVPTVKRCPPFLEAITCGYILPLAAEVVLTATPQGLHARTIGLDVPLLSAHHAAQYAGSPFARAPLVKVHNPWIVRTPPGYSSLFLPPLNRFLGPLSPLCGVVETDTYYREVHFPSICSIAPGATVRLPSGMPVVQVIPFRRDAWTSNLAPWDLVMRAAEIHANEADPSSYRVRNWNKKSYT